MGFFQKISNALSRFMYGRNGLDQLSVAMVAVELVIYVVSLFLKGLAAQILYFVCLGFWGVILFRTFSRNLEKRRGENARFLSWWLPLKKRYQAAKKRRADKTHKYFRCKCGAYCRVPRGKGKIIITCPKCHNKMECKS